MFTCNTDSSRDRLNGQPLSEEHAGRSLPISKVVASAPQVQNPDEICPDDSAAELSVSAVPEDFSHLNPMEGCHPCLPIVPL